MESHLNSMPKNKRNKINDTILVVNAPLNLELIEEIPHMAT